MFIMVSEAMKKKRRFVRITSVGVALIMCVSASLAPVFGSSFSERIFSKIDSAVNSGNSSDTESDSNSATCSTTETNRTQIRAIDKPLQVESALPDDGGSVFEESQNFVNNLDSANFVPIESSGSSSAKPSASNVAPTDPIKTSAASNNRPSSKTTLSSSLSTLSESKTTSGATKQRISLHTNLQDYNAVFLSLSVLDNVIDVFDNDWFRYAVIWTYQNGIMHGTSASTFSPDTALTTAMVASTLARIQKIDLSEYSSDEDAWYSAACAWAEQSLLFDEIGEIVPDKLIDRGQMASILAKFLDLSEANLEVTGEDIVFADRSLMSDKENEAFQLLYALGILKGKGDFKMAPRDTLTRAELALIMYSIRDYCNNAPSDVSSRR